MCFRYILENALCYAATKNESHTPSVNSLPFLTFMLRAKKKKSLDALGFNKIEFREQGTGRRLILDV